MNISPRRQSCGNLHVTDNATFLEIFLNVTACDTEQYQCYVLSTGTDEGQAQASLEVSNRNYSLS